MKKIFIILFFLLLLTGCNDYVEINELAVVTGIVVDYKDDMFEITAQIIETQEESIVKTYTTKSTSIEKAMAEISRLCDKELFFPHLKVLIITENIIENNINYTDLFLRNAKAKMNFNVFLVNSDIAEEILNIYKNISGSALYIDKTLEYNEKTFSTSTSLDFIEAVKHMLEYGVNPIYPTISIINNSGEKKLYLDNLVTYNKDLERLELNESESVFYNILNNNAKRTIMDMYCGENMFTLDLREMDTKFKFKDDIFTISIKIVGKVDTYKCTYDINDIKTINKLTDIAEKYITKQVMNLINNAKKNNNDYIGFGTYIYKHNPKYFDFKNGNWDKKFKNLNFKVKSKVSIISSGETRNSVGDKNAKNK